MKNSWFPEKVTSIDVYIFLVIGEKQWFKHTSSKANKVVDALSRKGILLTTLRAQIIDVDHIPSLYESNSDFGVIWKKCINHTSCTDFHTVNEFLFKGDAVCIPHTSLTSLRESILLKKFMLRVSWDTLVEIKLLLLFPLNFFGAKIIKMFLIS